MAGNITDTNHSKLRLIFIFALFTILFTLAGCRIFDGYSEDSSVAPMILSGKIVIDGSSLSMRSAIASSAIKPASLTGKVSIEGAEIWIEDLPEFPHQFTDKNGDYEFKNVPPGPHRVVCKFTNAAGTIFKNRSEEITANLGSTPVEPLEVLEAKNFVSGILRDTDGNPIPPGTVFTLWGEPFYVKENGSFECGPLPAGFSQADIVITGIPGAPSFTLPFISSDAPAFVEQTVLAAGQADSFVPAGFLLATLNGVVTNLVQPGDLVQLTAIASNTDTARISELNFVWACTDGIVTPESDSSKASWRAPLTLGMATVSVRIEHQAGMVATASLPLLIGITDPSQALKAGPQIVERSPAADAVEVALSTEIVATFSQALLPGSLNAESFVVSLADQAVSGELSLNDTSKIVTFTPGKPLEEGKTYKVTCTTAIKNQFGIALTETTSWNFTTAAPSPVVVSKSPDADAVGIAVDATIVVAFSKALKDDSVTATSFAVTLDDSAVAGSIAPSVDGKTLTFTPTAAFTEGKTYQVACTTAIQAANGTALAAAANWSFTTIAPAPEVVNRAPAANAVDVAIDAKIVVTFSKALKADSVTATSFAVTVDDSAVAGSIAPSVDGKTLTFTPTAAFTEGKTYQVACTTAIKAVNGTALAAAANWSFTIASRPAVPTGLVASEKTDKSFTITWGAVAKATSYNVYLDGALYQNVTGAVLLQIDGRATMTTYQVQVSAVNEIGESAKSGVLAVATLLAPEFRMFTGYKLSVGIKDDGSLVDWGDDKPAGIPTTGQYTIVSGESLRGYALRTDGTIVTWGTSGTYLPPTDSGYSSFSFNYSYGIAIKDGVLVNFPTTTYQGLPAENNGFKQVSVGFGHYIALKTDGSVVGGGNNTYNQAVSKSGPYKFIAAGYGCNFALKEDDGSIESWGYTGVYPDDPAGNPAGNPIPADSGYKQISVDREYGLALKDDGTIVKWGSDTYVKNNDKPANDPANPYISIAATRYNRALLLRKDGTVIHWGDNSEHLGTPAAGAINLK